MKWEQGKEREFAGEIAKEMLKGHSMRIIFLLNQQNGFLFFRVYVKPNLAVINKPIMSIIFLKEPSIFCLHTRELSHRQVFGDTQFQALPIFPNYLRKLPLTTMSRGDSKWNSARLPSGKA
ncbi:MAG TPA: hypothetical protein VHD83_18385 [Puia sp.]|nr:hypothetical protein [Puia sp.]